MIAPFSVAFLEPIANYVLTRERERVIVKGGEEETTYQLQ